MNPLVLVIDDDPTTATLLLGTAPLTGVRFDVRMAADGVRAVRAVAERMPDLVVLSAELAGGLSWAEVILRLRDSGCSAPVIVVTKTGNVSETAAFELGVRDVLRKPLNAPWLRQTLTSALKDVRYRREVKTVTSELGPVARDTDADAEVERQATPTSREFDVLYSLGKSVTALTDLDEILHRVVNASVYITDAEQGGLMLYDAAKQELVIRAAKNADQRIARTLTLRTTDSAAGEVINSAKSVLVQSEDGADLEAADVIRSALYVPMKVGAEVIGVLTVNNQRVARPLGGREERLLSAMADYAAVAIRNAQMYTELHNQNKALGSALQELAEADQLKDMMIQNLSHELRSPLVFIKGFIEMLHKGEFGPLSDEIMSGVRLVRKRVADLVKIIENTVVLSQSDQVEVRPETVVLSDLIRRVADKHQDKAAQTGITLVADLPDAPLLAKADPKYIQLVISNLLDNAIKFSPDGGLVTISARSVASEMVEVIVSDAGVGIPSDKVDRIFGRFYQVDGSTTRQFGGAGLGLAAAREVIAAHGGALTVDSLPGQGSIFRFTLPKSEVVLLHSTSAASHAH